MSIGALIFDVDGTLADTEALHRGSFNAAFDALRLGWHWTRDDYRGLLDVTGGKERLAHYIGSLRLPASERQRLLARVPEIHAGKTAHYTAGAATLALRPGVARLVDEALAAGCRLAIASTTSAANVEALLRVTGLRGFHVVACGDDVAAKKPAPDIYHLALHSLQLPASRCIAFEDSVHGLHAARAAGLRTVVMPTFWTAGGDFAEAALLLPADGEWPTWAALQRLAEASECTTP